MNLNVISKFEKCLHIKEIIFTDIQSCEQIPILFLNIWIEPTYITLPPLIQQWIGPYLNIPNIQFQSPPTLQTRCKENILLLLMNNNIDESL